MSSPDLFRRIRALKLSAGDKLTLMLVATYTDREDANAFPSVPRLANDSGCTARAVQQRLARLRRAGYLEVQAPARQHRPRTYRVVVPDVRHESPFTPAMASEVKHGSPPTSSAVKPRSRKGEPGFASGVNAGSHDQYRDQFRDRKNTGAARRTAEAKGSFPSSTDGDWFTECRLTHGGACGGRMRHRIRMLTDAYRAKESA
jgi:hypothetical protein